MKLFSLFTSKLAFLTASLVSAAAFSAAVSAQVPPPAVPAAADGPSALSGQLLEQLLLGELFAQENDPARAFQLILEAARRTADERLYSRALQIALQSGSGDSAVQAGKAWRAAHPKSREANRQYLQVLVAMNRLSETPELIQQEIALAPESERQGLIALSPRFFARVGDKKVAAGVLQQALAPFLDKPATGAQAWTSVGRMRFAAADLSGAVQAAEKGHAVDSKSLSPMLLAADLIDAKVPQAEAMVKRFLAVQLAPDVRMAYARSLLQDQRYAEALTQTEQLTRERPAMSEAWLMLGALLQNAGRTDEAEKVAKAYVEMTESDTGEAAQIGRRQAFLTLAEIAEKRKDFVAAESWLNKIGESDELIAVTLRRASILVKQGQMGKARELIRNQPERGAQDARSKALAEISLVRDEKMYREAFDLLKAAVARFDKDPDLLFDQAMMAEKLNDFAELERLLREVIAAKPNSSTALNALGYSFADRSVNLPEAKTLIQKALELAPGDPFITDSLGWVEFRAGNLVEATRILETAYKDKPDPEIAAHLGEVLWVAGQRERAVKVWQEGMVLNATNETLLETIKRLKGQL